MKHSTQHSEETKRKIAEAIKGRFAGSKHPFYGKHHSEETKKKLSEANKGHKNPMYGKHYSDEARKKMSGKHPSIEARKKMSEAKKGKHRSEEHKRKLSEAKKGKNNPSWRGGKVETICKICNKKFYIHPSIFKYSGGKFCSRRCSSIWRNKHIKTKDTSIELAIEQELIKQNIPYLKQAPVEGIALVDFLLPNKIIVQCDGGYWHSREINKGRDIAQDTVLFFKGYKVYRFWEKDIKKSAKKCIDKITGDIYGIINPLKKSA